MAVSIRKNRIEIQLTKQDSLFIRKYICKDGETRKQAIERIVKQQIERVSHKLKPLM